MAIFGGNDNKRIQNFFESINYPVYFFNNSKEKYLTTDKERSSGSRYYEYTDNEELDGFYAEPIKVEGVEKGDRFAVYFRDNDSWYIRNRVSVNDGKLVSSESTTIKIVQLSKGSKYMLDSEVAISEDIYKEQSEFANFENFEDVNAPDYSVLLADNPQVSSASKKLDVEKLTDSQIKKAEEKLKLEEKALKDSLLAKEEGVIESAMWTFDEVDELYNTQITTKDKRAFFIYLQNKNRKKLKGGFAEKYGSSYPAQAVDIIELMTAGALFFDPTAPFGERLQPKVIYESGNIYKKWNSLEKNQEYFVNRFGQNIYDNHVAVLDNVWKEVWDNRLKCNTKDDNVRLSMLPISNMAETIKIQEVINPADREQIEKNFQIYTNFRKGERIEDIAGFEYGANANYINKTSLSLKDGFIRWCRMAGSGEKAQNIGVQWSKQTPDLDNLMKYYLKPVSNPFKKEKGGEDKFERKKDDARSVGIRLFSQFLQEGLTSKDQWKVEYLFNSVYNAYKEPNLEQVPIGFTYKKYIDNRGLFVLRKANLNALRYFMSRGSIGLAYGVGLGKTFCSIFVMKQALDLGICDRPMVIVPNQVYFQFSQEIVRGLGQDFNPKIKGSRLNMFYNGSGIYNELGNNAVDGINLCTYEATKLFAFEEKSLKEQGTQWLDDAIQVLEMGTDELLMNPAIKKQNEDKYRTSIFNIEVDIDESEETESKDIDTDDIDFGFEEGGSVEEFAENLEEGAEVIYLNTQTTNYDFVCVDEAHNFNNLFEKVVSAPKQIQTGSVHKKTGKVNIQREVNPYSNIRETSGGKDASGRATKLWWLSQYVQSKSPMGNTLLLSATPFTNSPLQLFTMLSFLNYKMLEDAELGVIKDFFDLFAKVEYAEDFRTDLSIVKRNKLVGWRNIIAMQKYVYRVFDKSSREEEDEAVIRPNKITLPLKRIMINKEVYDLPKENFISTTIKLSNRQSELWERVRQYAKKGEDALSYDKLCNEENQNTTFLGKYVQRKSKASTDEEGAENNVENADDLADGSKEGEKAKDSAKSVLCLMWGRQICLNPYLFKCSGYKTNPTAKEYVEASPKMLYIMECIKTIKQFHENSESSPYMSGQVIYMNFGVQGFQLVRDYLIDELGFDKSEVGIISGKGNYIGKKKYQNKQNVADAFLGRVFDKEKESYVPLPHSKRVKVLIGSEAIKEGINLQNYASVLYNSFLDFNPTDIVQVEGRIWRQGNEFANVRIVTPLMSDCIDVFMFQKLEDKTERINQIWTKTGEVNELDTTAFNPAELKYELLSDPRQIATLEVEYKKEKLDEDIVDESTILSANVGLKSIYASGEKVKYPMPKTLEQGSFYFGVYNAIRLIRPDLLDKPLWNDKEWKNFIGKCNKAHNSQVDYKETNPSVWANFSNRDCDYDGTSRFNWESQRNTITTNPLYREDIGLIYNYSAEELVSLMVQLLKEQKIAYPVGYSKNWKEVWVQETEQPIYEGEEVSYKSKKGRKTGIAEFVMSQRGVRIIQEFHRDLMRDYFKDIDLDDALKKLKLQNVFPKDFFSKDVIFQRDGIDIYDDDILDYTDKEVKGLTKLFKYYTENPDTDGVIYNDDGSLMNDYKPEVLDIGDMEEVNVESKQVKPVNVKESKGAKPTKYPDPFKWGSKDFKENIKDIRDYLLKRKELEDKDYPTIYWSMSLPIEEQNVWNYQSWSQTNFASIIVGDGSSSDLNTWELGENDYKKTIKDTWVGWEETFNSSYGLFYYARSQFYDIKIPKELAEFRVTQQKKFEPLGITSINEIQTMIDASKERINTLKLEQEQLDNEEVFEEIVQEVVRRQEELNAEEIRAGSSYLARVQNFAESNPDYLGNRMLEVFNNTPAEQLEQIQVQYRPSDRAIAKALADASTEVPITEIEVVEEQTTENPTMQLIEDLRLTLDFDTDEGKKKTEELIADLELAMEFE